MAQRPHVPASEAVVLFSYGTLQQPEVQDDVLGRRPDGWPDQVPNHRLDWITISDPEVIRLSGSGRHPPSSATPEVPAWPVPPGISLDATWPPPTPTRSNSTPASRSPLGSGVTAWVYTLATDQ